MNKFKVNWMAKKSEDWIVAALIDEGGTEFKEVSINRTNKKGEVFPNFDGIMPGTEIEGNMWTSDAGKHYLFAPKPQRAGGRSFSKSKEVVEGQLKVQEEISKNVAKAQDRTAWMWAKNNAATLIAATSTIKESGFDSQGIADAVIELATKIYNGEPTDPF